MEEKPGDVSHSVQLSTQSGYPQQGNDPSHFSPPLSHGASYNQPTAPTFVFNHHPSSQHSHQVGYQYQGQNQIHYAPPPYHNASQDQSVSPNTVSNQPQHW